MKALSHKQVELLFHRLWTKAVGTPEYDKPQWMLLCQVIEGLDKNADFLLRDDRHLEEMDFIPGVDGKQVEVFPEEPQPHESYICQFCDGEFPAEEWGGEAHTKCPGCGKKYDAILAQDSETD